MPFGEKDKGESNYAVESQFFNRRSGSQSGDFRVGCYR